jgi:L-lactate dehydrogenase complex protein LldG
MAQTPNSASAKENILKSIRESLSTPQPLPFPEAEGNNSLFNLSTEPLEVVFAQEFTKLQGKFMYCADASELKQQLATLIESKGWQKIHCQESNLSHLCNTQVSEYIKNYPSIQDADAAITTCEALIARTGTLMLTADSPSGRTVSVYTPIHIVIAFQNQLLPDLRAATQYLHTKYGNNLPSMINWATGPSRTADIEKTLVVGVHGPKEVYVYYVDEIA